MAVGLHLQLNLQEAGAWVASPLGAHSSMWGKGDRENGRGGFWGFSFSHN